MHTVVKNERIKKSYPIDATAMYVYTAMNKQHQKRSNFASVSTVGQIQ